MGMWSDGQWVDLADRSDIRFPGDWALIEWDADCNGDGIVDFGQIQSGQLSYDNYGGSWGEQKYLNSFLQAYAVEKAKIEARKKGHMCSETRLEDGSIRVTIRVGGAA
jgi:hypothetical protein